MRRPPSLCDEEYPPLDGAYQNRTYGRRLSLAAVKGFWEKTFRLAARGAVPAGVGLYVHWPFCRARCAYCYCDSRAAASAAETERYLDALRREMRVFRGTFRGVRLSSLILAGGTPTQASAAQLQRLFDGIDDCFQFQEDADIAVEASPDTLTAARARLLRRRGVRRIDLGIDAIDAAVLRAAGRPQSLRSVRRACAAVKDEGMSLEVGLIFGIERQTGALFIRDLVRVLGIKPARIRIYGFEPRPQTLCAPSANAPAAAQVFALADKLMRRAGYGTSSGMWSVPPSYLGIGWSAKSRCCGAGWYQHPPLGRTRPVTDQLPPFAGMALSLAEEKRGELISRRAVLGNRRGLHRHYSAGVRRELRRVHGKDWANGNGTAPAELECRVYERRAS
ncbi:MAG: radical SAM protein [Elusimicrobiota bacterium]